MTSTKWSVGDALKCHGNQGASESADKDTANHQQHRFEAIGRRIPDEGAHQEKGCETTRHEDLGVREVDQAQDPVDHGVTNGHHRVDESIGESINQEWPEFFAQDAEMCDEEANDARHLFFPILRSRRLTLYEKGAESVSASGPHFKDAYLVVTDLNNLAILDLVEVDLALARTHEVAVALELEDASETLVGRLVQLVLQVVADQRDAALERNLL